MSLVGESPLCKQLPKFIISVTKKVQCRVCTVGRSFVKNSEAIKSTTQNRKKIIWNFARQTIKCRLSGFRPEFWPNSWHIKQLATREVSDCVHGRR